MKKLCLLCLALFLLAAAAGCAREEPPATAAGQTVTVQALNGQNERTDIVVPLRPKRVAILDMAALDIIDALGEGQSVVGMADTKLAYLKPYAQNPDIKNLGTIKEADLEAVMASRPDIIFIGGRLQNSYEQLSQIAPVVYLSTDMDKGLVESIRANARTIAKIFGDEEKADALLAGVDGRIAALREKAAGHSAIVGMCTSGSFNVLGERSRCSLISREIGFANIGTDAKRNTAAHGSEASFEYLVQKDPDYIFVLDRDAAIGINGAKLAPEIMENDLVKSTRAHKGGHVAYLAHPEAWYTAEGGISSLSLMLDDLEAVL